jgi:hypothetical protein
MRLTLAVLFFFLSSLVFATKIPDSSWQPGTLTSIDDEQLAVTTEHEHAYGSHRHSTTTDTSYTIPHYFIDATGYTYETIANGGDRRRSLSVTINGPLKYAFVGTDLYIQDEQGKEHKMTILKKTFKTPQPAEQN